MSTLAELVDRTGFDVLAHLDRDVTIPVLSGLQAQGDLIVVPAAELSVTVGPTHDALWIDVPAAGVEVLRGTAMGNPHTLLCESGCARWTTDVQDPSGLALGVLEASAATWLAHPEHGYAGIAPGTYVVRRQREQADELRLVAD